MKISKLPVAEQANDTDIIPIVQNGETKQVTRDKLCPPVSVPTGLVLDGEQLHLAKDGKPVGAGVEMPQPMAKYTQTFFDVKKLSSATVPNPEGGTMSSLVGYHIYWLDKKGARFDFIFDKDFLQLTDKEMTVTPILSGLPTVLYYFHPAEPGVSAAYTREFDPNEDVQFTLIAEEDGQQIEMPAESLLESLFYGSQNATYEVRIDHTFSDRTMICLQYKGYFKTELPQEDVQPALQELKALLDMIVVITCKIGRIDYKQMEAEVYNEIR